MPCFETLSFYLLPELPGLVKVCLHVPSLWMPRRRHIPTKPLAGESRFVSRIPGAAVARRLRLSRHPYRRARNKIGPQRRTAAASSATLFTCCAPSCVLSVLTDDTSSGVPVRHAERLVTRASQPSFPHLHHG